MKKFCITLLFIFIISMTPYKIKAATTANATLTYTISSVDAISVSGNPGALNVTTATAGNNPSTVADSSTKCNVTTNNSSRRITAALSSNMPTGLTLTASISAPTGATSSGETTLSTTTAALVTGITQLAQTGLTITYQLTATVAAAQVSGATKTVTYTIGP